MTPTTTRTTSGLVKPGVYSVAETVPDGWSLTSISCPVADIVTATATVTLAPGAIVTCTFTNAKRGDLTIDKVVAAGSPVNNGDGTWTIIYDLTVKSESNIPEDYDLEDELAFGDGIVPTTAGVVSNNGVTVNGGWDGVGDTVVATGATMPALGTHTYTVTVTATIDDEMDVDAADCAVADGGFRNVGSIEFWSGTDTADACASLPVSDLEITKDAPFGEDFEPAVGPTQFDYDITVINLGPATAEDVVVEDELPTGLEFVSVTTSVGTCGFNTATRIVTCQLGDLAVADPPVAIEITVVIPVAYPITEGQTTITFINEATTSTITPESDLTNNEDDAETTVLVTLPDPPDDPEVPTLALTGAAIGFATQLGLSLLLVGIAFAGMSLRRRSGGRHVA
jgi:uncharacterized repeat protein (TIGR01451 family)